MLQTAAIIPTGTRACGKVLHSVKPYEVDYADDQDSALIKQAELR